MAQYEFDFQRYVDRQKSKLGTPTESDEFGDYAFAGDVRILRKLERAKPVRVVAEAAVRFWKSAMKNKLLGEGVKLNVRQFPEVYEAVVSCSHRLGIAIPNVYISQSYGLNAGTYGTDDEAFIVLGGALLNLLEPKELEFVIGHECGHLQNNHATYRTAVAFLSKGVGAYLKWAVVPATIALNSWSRRAEITCDRAGLVCCQDELAATQAMLKLATGSRELAARVDVEDYLAQIDGIKQGIGRFSELLASHPYLPKRVHALRLFAKSSYFATLIGERGGRPLDEIDREVEELIQVM